MLICQAGFFGGARAPTILATTGVFGPAQANPIDITTYVLPAGANRLVVAVFDDNDRTVSSITWTATGASAQDLTQRRRESNGTSPQTSVELWDLVAPNAGSASGAGTLSITRSGTSDAGVVVWALRDAHTDAPVVSGQNGASVSNPPALAIDPDPNSVIFDIVCGGSTGVTVTFDGSETSVADQDLGTTCRFSASQKTVSSGSATTVDCSFSGSQNRYAQIAAAYKGA